MLQVDNVSYAYPSARGSRMDRRYVVDEVTFDLARGTITGLLGPNGAGKTTLLRLLSGTLEPTHGRVTLERRDIGTFTRREFARRVAVVPQETHVAFDFTALEIVLMGRYAHLGPFALEGAADLAIARDALAATGTAHLEARRFSTLSGGEKQRVVIASALAQGSDVLLLDEPTASLDLGYQIEIAALLTRLNRDRSTTMVVSTHDLNFAAAVCAELVLLKAGRLVVRGKAAAVLTPEAIRQLYDVEADVQYHARAGHLTVVPLARAH